MAGARRRAHFGRPSQQYRQRGSQSARLSGRSVPAALLAHVLAAVTASTNVAIAAKPWAIGTSIAGVGRIGCPGGPVPLPAPAPASETPPAASSQGAASRRPPGRRAGYGVHSVTVDSPSPT